MKTTPSLPATTTGRTGQTSAMSRPEAARPAARVPLSSGKPLSNAQKAAISQTARQAFDIQDRAGQVDGWGSDSKRFETWRREQQAQAVGIASLRECGNNHYRPLMSHFLCLAGKHDTAFTYTVKTGRVKDHGQAEDTHESRETRRALIMQALVDHGHRCDNLSDRYEPHTAASVAAKGGLITAGYVIAIAKGKCRGKALDSLTATQLDQILYTVRNRISAREGKGDTQKRNNAQRKNAPSPSRPSRP